MPGLLDIQVKTRKNGSDGSWFRDTLGRRVGTSARLSGNRGAIVTAEQLAWLASYYIELQQEQLDAGIGSSGAPMPPLSQKQHAIFVTDKNTGKRRFVRQSADRGYRAQKQRKVGRSVRDLDYTGEMRRDIRINYLDDRMAKISITRLPSRIKALANERRCPWWGLTPANARKFAQAQATIFGGAMEDYLDSLGLVQAGNYMVRLAREINRWKAALARRAA